MEKLTLEQLAPYFPYRLKGVKDGEKIEAVLLGIYGTGGHSLTLCERINNHNTVDYDCQIDDFKPLLRPLSDLTKEITHNGETFVPIQNIAIYSPTDQGLPYLIEQIKTGFIEVIVFNKLIEWHFDVFGLIGKELAIDLNTIK